MQDLYIGKENLEIICSSFHNKNIKRIFLVTGKHSYVNSKAKYDIELLLKNFSITYFSEFQENPKIEDLNKGIELFNCNNCQAIIAIGGGSVIDMAKLIKSYYSSSNESLKELIIENRIIENELPLYAIPTTAGSGSEATHFAVIYISKKKYSVASNSITPKKVFLIPEYTYSASEYLTAVTGIDAFSQAIESMWSVNSTQDSLEYSRKAITLIWNNLRAALRNEEEARSNMIYASYLAGKAINIAKTTGPHALSYGVTANFNLPHGHSVALFLPVFVKLHKSVNEDNCNDNRGSDWVKKILYEISHLIDVTFDDLEKDLSDFIIECGIELNIKKLAIYPTELKQIITNFNTERMKNNPLKICNDNIEEIFNILNNNN